MWFEQRTYSLEVCESTAHATALLLSQTSGTRKLLLQTRTESDLTKFLILFFPSCPPAATHECYNLPDGADYSGTLSVTTNGKKCQRWDSQTPHDHTRTAPVDFPDRTLAEAENYCRNPDGESRPWCYTITSTRWETCDVPRCSGGLSL